MQYLQQTIRSIRNSANQNYQVIVAGNEEPELEGGFDGKLHFLSVNNQFPSHLDARAAQRSDKLAKIGAAWTHSKSKWQPKYVMKLDADDFISSRLVGWLDENGTEAGHLIRHGWLWRSGARHLIQRTEYIDRVCGSCLNHPERRRGPSRAIFDRGGRHGVWSGGFVIRDERSLLTRAWFRDHHVVAQRHSSKVCRPVFVPRIRVNTFPFDGLIYRASSDSMAGVTGDRTHEFSLRMCLGAIRRTTFITRKFRKEFMLA